MRLCLGADDATHLIGVIVGDLLARGHQVEVVGPPGGEPLGWPDVAWEVARRVADGRAEQGVLACWTGTGVCMAANKVAGIRAALCADAETARGARRWNDANVLCLSLRSTSEVIAKEILDAWFGTTETDPTEEENIARLRAMDQERRS